MRASSPETWSDEDVDLVVYRTMTTINQPGLLQSVLPEFLKRAVGGGDRGWMTDAELVRAKLEATDFDNWSADDRAVVLPLIAAYSHSADDNASLNDWLHSRLGQEA